MADRATENRGWRARRTGGAGDVSSDGKPAIGGKVFDENGVQSYYLTFPDEEYAKLMDMSTLLLNPWTVNEDRYVKASLRVGDQEIPSIGVRFKGQFSIWGCVDISTGTRRVRVEPVFRNIDVCQRFLGSGQDLLVPGAEFLV